MTRHTYRLWLDQDTESPLSYDSSVKMVVLHRRYSDPAKGECGTTPESVAAWERKNKRSWHIVPLWMYDHSGTVYRAGERNPFTCPWDSGRVGIIAIRKSEFPKDKRQEAIDSICEAYTAWANGDCWGYDIVDDNGETVDSCGGFIGRDYAEQCAQEALEALQPLAA